MGDHEKNLINWIPAHPAYGVVSMHYYWHSLKGCYKLDDPYDVRSLLSSNFNPQTINKANRFTKIVTRKALYPYRIKKNVQGKLAHILDHSWSDMVNSIPRGVRRVITVHDLIPLRYPEKLSRSQVDRFKKIVYNLNDADCIISISEYTKREVVDFLGIPEYKVKVVPLGVGDMSVNDDAVNLLRAKIPNSCEGKLLLGSIGNTLERKNLKILGPAIKEAKLNGLDVYLVRAGAKLPDALSQEIIRDIGAGNFCELGFLSAEELKAFYKLIDGFVVPSLFEGFGLPLLEAMSAGVSTLSSNATSLPEVGGDAPFYFNPKSPEELSHCLVNWSDSGNRAKSVRKGLQQARKFSWRNTLDSYYEIYSQLI